VYAQFGNFQFLRPEPNLNLVYKFQCVQIFMVWTSGFTICICDPSNFLSNRGLKRKRARFQTPVWVSSNFCSSRNQSVWTGVRVISSKRKEKVKVIALTLQFKARQKVVTSNMCNHVNRPSQKILRTPYDDRMRGTKSFRQWIEIAIRGTNHILWGAIHVVRHYCWLQLFAWPLIGASQYSIRQIQLK
jgi:hypothetical protein